MHEKIKAQYDSLYSQNENVFGGGRPSETVKQMATLIPAGNIVDLGGGEGRNAIFLAEQGLHVAVIDLSTVSSKRLSEYVTKNNLPLIIVVGDITDSHILGESLYEGVVCTNVLHHLEIVAAEAVVKNAQNHTALGGIHVIETFGNRGGLADRARGKNRYYPSETELGSLYSDWEILTLTSEESVTKAKDKAGKHMTNQLLKLVAQKPA